MIIWRGWGLLILACAAAAALLVIPIGVWFAGQSYPDNPYAFDLFEALQPLAYGAVWVVTGIAAGAMSWVLGSWLNRNGNAHSLFFIPAQWWGVVFPVIGLSMLLVFATDGGGLKGAHSSFVTQCDKHEIGGNETRCDCMATAIEAENEPVVYIPFYADMEKAWRSRNGDENVIPHFIEGYLATQPPEKVETFLGSLDKAAACFDDVREAPPQPEVLPHIEPAPEPAPAPT